MGKKHDEIVFSLTEEKIKKILEKEIFGEIGLWGIHPTSSGFSLSQLNTISIRIGFDEDKPISELIKIYEDKKSEVLEVNKRGDGLKVEKTIEKPIVKGEGQYRVTKGYLDIFCSLKPFSNELFSSYQSPDTKYAIIEVKKLSDFNDVGSIIRQLNEYQIYFGNSFYTKWYVYCDETIPDMAKQMLEKAGYKVIEEEKWF